MTQESFHTVDAPRELNRKQLLLVLEEVATYASNLNNLMVMALERVSDREGGALVGTAQHYAAVIGAMADDALGGKVRGDFHEWLYESGFAQAGAAK